VIAVTPTAGGHRQVSHSWLCATCAGSREPEDCAPGTGEGHAGTDSISSLALAIDRRGPLTTDQTPVPLVEVPARVNGVVAAVTPIGRLVRSSGRVGFGFTVTCAVSVTVSHESINFVNRQGVGSGALWDLLPESRTTQGCP